MLVAPLFLLAGLARGAPAAPIRPAELGDRVRGYVATHTDVRGATAGVPIPAWARKYNMNCNVCHYPAAPHLNQVGIMFKWRGFRMPGEMGKSQEVDQVSNYVAMRGRLRYQFNKTSGAPASQSSFKLNDATLFYGGPFGKNYYAWFEFEREGDELGVNTYVGSLWGKENSFGGFRAGNFHVLKSGGVAGLDRPVGINQPMPLGLTTSTVPFAFPAEELGLEGFYVLGRNRLSAQVLNGVGPDGEPHDPDTDTRKDLAVIDQLLLDSKGSAIEGAAYYGRIVGLDPAVSATLPTTYWRLVATASKIVSNFELLGGFVWGKDKDIPTGTPSPGLGYWVSGQYVVPKSAWTLYSRYEIADPNTDVANDGRRRFVAGTLVPVGLPEYVKLTAEYWLDIPQLSGAPKTNHVVGEVQLVF